MKKCARTARRAARAASRDVALDVLVCFCAGPSNRHQHTCQPPSLTTKQTTKQGTTCVYSKKVEYLHNLVFRALETIHSKKQRERAAAEEEGGARRGGRQVRALICVCRRAQWDKFPVARLWCCASRWLQRQSVCGSQTSTHFLIHSPSPCATHCPPPPPPRQANGDDLDGAFLALDEVAAAQVAGDGDIDLEEESDGDGDGDAGARAHQRGGGG